jgi:hypothetical protein
MVYSCAQAPDTVASVKLTSGDSSHTSMAVAVPVLAGNVLAVHRMVMLAGQVIVGATLSSIVMICTHDIELPQSSVATHVRVIVSSSGQDPPTTTSLKVIVGVPSQLSVALAEPVVAGNVLAEQEIVMFDGQAMDGATLSSTTITWRQVLVLPQSSVAVHVRLIVRSCGQLPAMVTSEKVGTTDGSQPSMAVALPVFEGSVLAVQRMVILAGQVITGAVISDTVITWMQFVPLPQSSWAVQVRVMMYSCAQLPPVVTSAKVGVTLGSHASVAVALPVFAGNVLSSQSIVILAGQVTDGGRLSCTVIN